MIPDNPLDYFLGILLFMVTAVILFNLWQAWEKLGSRTIDVEYQGDVEGFMLLQTYKRLFNRSRVIHRPAGMKRQIADWNAWIRFKTQYPADLGKHCINNMGGQNG